MQVPATASLSELSKHRPMSDNDRRDPALTSVAQPLKMHFWLPDPGLAISRIGHGLGGGFVRVSKVPTNLVRYKPKQWLV